MERLRKNEICKVIWPGWSQSLQALHIYSKMKNGLNLPELIYTLGILVLDLHWDQKWAGLKVILWKQFTFSHWGCSFWFSLLSSSLKMQHSFLIFTDLSITGLWGGKHRNNVQLDKMAKWIESTISTFHNPAKVSRGCTQPHADPRAPLSCRATEGVEARHFGSFLVSQVPKVADHHHHIWAAAAWNYVCPDPTQPCSNSALQVFDCYHPILTVICCQK